MTTETLIIRTADQLDIARLFPGLRIKFVQDGIYKFWEAAGPAATIDALVDAIVGAEPSDAWLRARGH